MRLVGELVQLLIVETAARSCNQALLAGLNKVEIEHVERVLPKLVSINPLPLFSIRFLILPLQIILFTILPSYLIKKKGMCHIVIGFLSFPSYWTFDEKSL